MRGFGADVVVARSDDFAGAVRAVEPDGVAAVYDTALLNDAAFGAIRDGGGLVVVRGWRGGDPPRGIRVHPVMVREVLERTEWLEELRRLASEGRLTLRVAARFGPEEAAEAHRLMDAGGLRGRALITFCVAESFAVPGYTGRTSKTAFEEEVAGLLAAAGRRGGAVGDSACLMGDISQEPLQSRPLRPSLPFPSPPLTCAETQPRRLTDAAPRTPTER